MKIIDLHFQNIENIIAAFLIDATEPILIETGPDSTFEHLISRLKEHGLSQQDIKHVFVTHIHLDHSGAAWHFAQSKAKIYVHPKGARHLVDPSRLESGAQIVYKNQAKSLFGNIIGIDKDYIVELEDEKEINICGKKIMPVFTPGHAKHHVCFFTDDYLFSGDALGVRLLDGPILPPMPPPDVNLKEWLLSIEKLKKYNAQYICPTHFGCFELDKHLDTLSSHIIQHEAFINNSQDYEQFLKFIDSFFSGFNDKNIRDLYKLVLPDYMNFEGLLQYYKNSINQT